MVRSTPIWVSALAGLLASHVAMARTPDPTNQPARTRPDTVSVATLNAWGLPFPIAAHRHSRLPAIARFLERGGFDVVGLQEVWDGAQKHLSAPGLLYPPPKGDTGLAVASPHHATPPIVRHFTSARGFDALKKKGVIASKVTLPGKGDLWMVVTHMQAGGGPKNARVRSEQVGDVLDVVAGLEGPAVVVGDFNLYDEPTDHDSLARLLDAGLVDAAEAQGAIAPTYRTGTERFDRVFTRSTDTVRLSAVSAQVIQYGGDVPLLSDHHPVHVELDWAAIDNRSASR